MKREGLNNVIFDAKAHKYYNKLGAEYISTTTLVGLFKPKKDWKGIAEKFVNRRTKEELVKDLAKKYNKTESSVKEFLNKYGYKGSSIQKIWEYNKDMACAVGSEFHDKKEREDINRGYEKIEDRIHRVDDGLTQYQTDDLWHLPDGVYTELQLWNHHYLIAGKSDKVIVDGRYIDIDDYKTNEEIDKVSYFNAYKGEHDMMLPPIDHLMDCNFIHYTLQLSIYAYMLECFGYKIRKITFKHHPRKADKSITEEAIPYEVKYKRADVIAMLEYYRNNKKFKKGR